ncbi:helix-turn-helix transcriptional regulator [Rhodococcoides fascians A25f]|uniref:helix-turn-helix domain-containing protein n=1 Tax=Rhodococcoides fascians TaxID=1828 RepID=UPI000690C887|nr:helix-turn-helix transcriptional regulator [Rhodococcus fascians]QII04347.1 helix-turn-helix transcriptional regulator [Rhodococcus fascians A25f]
MAAKRVEIGATGETVRKNIARVRNDRGMTLRALSDTMSELGHPLSNSSISQIENGSRRVDVDDLMALAIALDVSPNTLLIEPAYDGDLEVNASGAERVSVRSLWFFLDGMRSLRTSNLDFAVASQPPFLRPATYAWRSTKPGDGPLLVSRMIESDGTDVSIRASFGYGTIFTEDD